MGLLVSVAGLPHLRRRREGPRDPQHRNASVIISDQAADWGWGRKSRSRLRRIDQKRPWRMPYLGPADHVLPGPAYIRESW